MYKNRGIFLEIVFFFDGLFSRWDSSVKRSSERFQRLGLHRSSLPRDQQSHTCMLLMANYSRHDNRPIAWPESAPELKTLWIFIYEVIL